MKPFSTHESEELSSTTSIINNIISPPSIHIPIPLLHHLSVPHMWDPRHATLRGYSPKCFLSVSLLSLLLLSSTSLRHNSASRAGVGAGQRQGILVSRQQWLRNGASAAAVAAVVLLVDDAATASDVASPSDTLQKVSPPAPAAPLQLESIIGKATKKALGGGLSGASASVVQVLTLMWARTVMNYQYRNGTTSREALTTLLAEGGIPRLYEGLPFALIQGPMSRFGDVAANDLCLLLLRSSSLSSGLPLPVMSAAGSLAAGVWRILLMPIDALKTCSQCSGSQGVPLLLKKVENEGLGALYEGAAAVCLATAVGHYPWFATFNYMDSILPAVSPDQLGLTLLRNASLGFTASCVSDTCSNSIRVVKNVKQTSPTAMTYSEAVRGIIAEDGASGLLGRGLGTRLAVNAVQGALFSVLWRYFEKTFFGQ